MTLDKWLENLHPNCWYSVYEIALNYKAFFKEISSCKLDWFPNAQVQVAKPFQANIVYKLIYEDID